MICVLFDTIFFSLSENIIIIIIILTLSHNQMHLPSNDNAIIGPSSELPPMVNCNIQLTITDSSVPFSFVLSSVRKSSVSIAAMACKNVIKQSPIINFSYLLMNVTITGAFLLMCLVLKCISHIEAHLLRLNDHTDYFRSYKRMPFLE